MAQSTSSTTTTTTKSIDVGGVFLIDLALNEAEPVFSDCDNDIATNGNERRRDDFNARFVSSRPLETILARENEYNQRIYHNQHTSRPCSTYQLNENDNDATTSVTQQQQQQQQQVRSRRMRRKETTRATTATSGANGSLGSALDRLESVINCDENEENQLQQLHEDERERVTTVIQAYDHYRASFSSSCSLSDESFVKSTSSAGTSLSSANLTGSADENNGSSLNDGTSLELATAARRRERGELNGEIDPDKASTTTREDSGVLDMKDLDSCGPQQDDCCLASASGQERAPLSTEMQQQQQQGRKEKSISAEFATTNLIMSGGKKNKLCDAASGINFQYQQKQQQQQQRRKPQTQRSIYRPTDGNDCCCDQELSNNYQHQHQHHPFNHNHNHNCHQHNQDNYRSNQEQQQREQLHRSKRPISSASLPIQVPAHQMKKNLNRMKLNLMKEEEQQQDQDIHQSQREQQRQKQQQRQQKQKPLLKMDDNFPANLADDDDDDYEEPVRKGDRNRPAIENIPPLCTADDDAAFLAQEFNANHQNHYPIGEFENEHLTAEEDPMRLFASIQALAKSLHEDAELFGSLPPKRMLESPIRSLALV